MPPSTQRRATPRLTPQIGRGAYGVVASAHDSRTGYRVAIKRISRLFSDLIDAKRILREIKLLRHLSTHDNVVGLLDLMTAPPDCEDFHTLYIVTHLFESDLDRIICSEQQLSDQHAQYFTYQILRGLKFIHSADVLHRDLKPSNLLVNSNCDLAICDFGLARGISDAVAADLTEYVVTRWYRAPELLCESKTYDSKVDVWSVGCVLGEILGRRPIFKGSSSREQLELILASITGPTAEVLKESFASGAMVEPRGIGPVSLRVASLLKHCRPAGKRAVDFTVHFRDASLESVDLMHRMLAFNASERITVQQALEHPWLAPLNSRAPSPTCSELFNFSFEEDYDDEMPMDLLQYYMFEELKVIREIGRKCLFPTPIGGSPQQRAEARAERKAAAQAAAEERDGVTEKVAMEMDAAVLPP